MAGSSRDAFLSAFGLDVAKTGHLDNAVMRRLELALCAAVLSWLGACVLISTRFREHEYERRIAELEEQLRSRAECGPASAVVSLPRGAPPVMPPATAPPDAPVGAADFREATPPPPLVAAWRRAALDWHELFPSWAELRLENAAQKGCSSGAVEIAREAVRAAQLALLTRYRASGLEGRFGRDFGPPRLERYAACGLLRDKCMVHDEADCGANALCAWDAPRALCVDRGAPSAAARGAAAAPCARARRFDCARNELVDVRNASAECARYVADEPGVLLSPPDDAKMFYHWWSFFRGVAAAATDAAGGGGGARAHYVFARVPSEPLVAAYMGTLSPYCWRTPCDEMLRRTCFCRAGHGGVAAAAASASGGRAGGVPDAASFLARQFGLDAATGADRAPRARVGFISRRRKRFVLNELELARAAEALGAEAVLLPLEHMTLYEQLRALRGLDVLVGVHGSGLNNALFMRRGAALVQLLPWNLGRRYKGAFAGVASGAGVSYLEYELPEHENASAFHWEYVARSELAKPGGRAAFLARRRREPGAISNQELYTFWINQDIIVDARGFSSVLAKALSKARDTG